MKKLLFSALLLVGACVQLQDAQATPPQGDRYVGGSLAASGGGHVNLGVVFGAQQFTYEYFELEGFGVRDLDKPVDTTVSSGFKLMLGDVFEIVPGIGLDVAAGFGMTAQSVGQYHSQANNFGYRAGLAWFPKPYLKIGAYYNAMDGQGKDKPFSKNKTYKFDDVSLGFYYYF